MVIKKEETYVLKLTEYREILNVLKTGDVNLVYKLMDDLKDIDVRYKRVNAQKKLKNNKDYIDSQDYIFEFDVQALCNKKQLPIDSFALTKIDSVTIKGLDKMKMEYAVNAFDTLYNLLLNNDNILVDQLNFDILNVFQKTFEYNLIGLQKQQNGELSDFIKRIIKNNEK